VAVFCGRKDTAAKICEDAADLFERTEVYEKPIDVSDVPEVERIATLFGRELGEGAPAARATALGIFPHHASVPHGLRLSIEYAMKVNLIRLVVCTSTLAQGVNLPIKYLIVTSVNQGKDRILVRDFHNLIGRAGRAGMYTEGSVIFADNSISLMTRGNAEDAGAGGERKSCLIPKTRSHQPAVFRKCSSRFFMENVKTKLCGSMSVRYTGSCSPTTTPH
jgi:Lhr-like helicase